MSGPAHFKGTPSHTQGPRSAVHYSGTRPVHTQGPRSSGRGRREVPGQRKKVLFDFAVEQRCHLPDVSFAQKGGFPFGQSPEAEQPDPVLLFEAHEVHLSLGTSSTSCGW